MISKSHWYCFTFVDNVGYKSTYMGYSKKDQITTADISKASKYANCQIDDSTGLLINLAYLGYMTTEQFNNGEINDSY